MAQPRPPWSAGGDGEATRARHFMAVPYRGGRPSWRRCLDGAGGRSKVRCQSWRLTTAPLLRGFFSCSPHFPNCGAGARALAGGAGPAARLVSLSAERFGPSLPGAWKPDPCPFLGGVCGLLSWPNFRQNIFPLFRQPLGGDDLLGNIGNMGTSNVRQAESCASGVRAPVPKPSGDFGNMGTEMPDPDAGKSARVWLPPAPSSR